MEILAALGFIALALIVAVCAVFLFTVQPIWRIAEMAASEKQLRGGKKLLVIASVLFLGPAMMSCYPCFRKQSRTLRRTTTFVFAIMVLAGVGAIGIAIGLSAKTESGRTAGTGPGARGTAAKAAAPLAFDRMPAAEVVPFTALHLVPKYPSGWSVRIAEFTGYGPKPEATIPLVLPSIYPITHVAVDPNGPVYYVITTHEVGRIEPTTGRFIELKPDPVIGKPSWPSAIAYDSSQHLLLVAARSRGYSYQPATGRWKIVPGLKGDDLIALTYAPDEALLYGLRTELGGGLATRLVTLNASSAVIGETGLSHAISVGQDPFALAQLCWSGKQLIVLVSPQAGHDDKPRATLTPAMYSVDPHSALCRIVDANAPAVLESVTTERTSSKSN